VAAEARATNRAVAATSGQTVTYGGKPAITYFFSSSGGYTENVEIAFPGSAPQAWLRGVPDPYDGAGGDPYHRWGRRMTLAAAAAKLSGLMDGSLVGIKVTKHGASPRVVAASVVGTKGHRTVSGAELQQRFGLLTTWAEFTTITTNAGAVARTTRSSAVGHSLDVTKIPAETAAAISNLVHQVMTPGIPIVYGSVFPGARGSPLLVQRLTGGRWRTVRHAHLGAGGAYRVRLPGAGSYRIVFQGLAGPTVRAG
jgi:stage II sporulation protein D